ncbi:MAG: sortase [Bacilli bacterium]|jgi:LPXTG-site transpeptidase (sortase) family protein|nr:sortase [Bacilli bacterium]
MQNKTKKQTYRNSQLIQIGFLLILFGVFLFGYQFWNRHKVKAQQTMNRKIYEASEQQSKKPKETLKSEQISPIATPKATESPVITDQASPTYSFIGILEIPRIGLKQGFVSKEDRHNNVEENITILPEATYPDQSGGNFILAAHSGTGAIAYFNELYHLQEHDKIVVYYQHKKYTYQVVKIYQQEKNGTIRIYRDRSETTITLITCTNHNDTKQTVYIANQVAIENT